MYRKAIRTKQTVFNLVGKDLETETKDVLTVIHPMYVGRTLWGAIFWELELRTQLDAFVRPDTYNHFHYPFFAILAPESIYNGQPPRLILQELDHDALQTLVDGEEYKAWLLGINTKLFESDLPIRETKLIEAEGTAFKFVAISVRGEKGD